MQPRSWLVSDVIASVVLAVLAAPEAISYAAIAGVSSANGLYTAFIAPIVYAATGTSPQLVTGPTTIMSMLTRNAMPATWGGQPLAEGSPTYIRIAATLALVVGVLQVALAFLRAGFFTRVISRPVLTGFTTGSALLIASTQFSTALGVPKCKAANGGTCTMVAAVSNIVANGGAIPAGVPIASLLCLLLLLGVKYGLPRLLHAAGGSGSRWRLLANTGPLLLLLIAIPVMYASGDTLASRWGIVPVDPIPPGLPAPSSPFPPGGATSGELADLFASAIPLAIIGYMESLTIATTIARQYGGYAVDSTGEMWALAWSNIAVALGKGYPVTGSFSRTAVNAASGARSAVSSLLAGLLLVLMLLVATPALSHLPKVATAAVVLSVIFKLVEVKGMAALWATDKRDFLVALTVFVVVITVDVAPALVVGIMMQHVVGLTRGYSTLYAIQVAGRGEASTSSVSSSSSSSSGGGSAGGDAAGFSAAGARPLPVDLQLAALHGAHSAVGGGVATGMASINGGAAGGAGAAAMPAAPASAGVVGGCVGGLPTTRVWLFPDLQFHHADRLRSALQEAAECYAPRVLVLDCSGVANADASGCFALLTEAETASGASGGDRTTCVMAVCVRRSVLLRLCRAAAATGRHVVSIVAGSGAGVGGGVCVGLRVGSLLVCASHAELDACYAAACAGTGSPAAATPAAATAAAAAAPVEGVPQSTLARRARQQRHQREPLCASSAADTGNASDDASAAAVRTPAAAAAAAPLLDGGDRDNPSPAAPARCADDDAAGAIACAVASYARPAGDAAGGGPAGARHGRVQAYAAASWAALCRTVRNVVSFVTDDRPYFTLHRDDGVPSVAATGSGVSGGWLSAGVRGGRPHEP